MKYDNNSDAAIVRVDKRSESLAGLLFVRMFATKVAPPPPFQGHLLHHMFCPPRRRVKAHRATPDEPRAATRGSVPEVEILVSLSVLTPDAPHASCLGRGQRSGVIVVW